MGAVGIYHYLSTFIHTFHCLYWWP